MKAPKLILATLAAGQIALLAGCSDNESSQQTSASPSEQTAPSTDPHAGMQLRLSANQGKVLSSKTAGGYTYAQVEQNGSTFWIAGAETQLNAGDIVNWGAKKLMRNFYSKAIDETFEDIYFVSSMESNHATTRLVGGGQQGHSRNIGRVMSMQNAGGYSYMQLETASGTQWLAVSQTNAVAEGDMVGWSGAAPMSNFTSKALNRTFDSILFASAVQKLDASAAAALAGGASATQGKVISAEIAGGYSYMEVETSNGNVWVAAPAGEVKAGDTISWSGAAPMTNFNSPSLGRTFDRILFAGSFSRVN